MKNILKTLAVAVFMMSAVAAFAQTSGGYRILNGKVYYNNVILHDADPQTIQDLGYGYAKDNENVWYEGKLLPLVDPHRFWLKNAPSHTAPVPPQQVPAPAPQQPGSQTPVLDGLLNVIFGNGAGQNGGQAPGNNPAPGHGPGGPGGPGGLGSPSGPAPGHGPGGPGHEHGAIHQERGYEVVANKVYYNGVLVSNALAHSFKDLGYGYAKDSKKVYYCGKKLTDNPSRFKVLADGYAMDSFDVYYFGEEIDASTAGFKVLSDGYAKDAFYGYYCGKKVAGSSGSTFKVTGNGYAKDAWETYYLGKKVR